MFLTDFSGIQNFEPVQISLIFVSKILSTW